MGPLHLHEGETTPHRDQESADQATIVAVPATTSVVPRATQLVDALAAPLVPQSGIAHLVPSVARFLLPPGSRSPPLTELGGTLPLLI